MPAPGFLLHSTRHDGIVRLLNHGSDHGPAEPAPVVPDPHYAKLAYSSRTAPGAAERSWLANVDSHIAVITEDGTASRRGRIERTRVRSDAAGSRYAATLPGGVRCAIETAVLVRGPWEIRAHLVLAPAGLTVREGGYVTVGAAPPTARTGALWASASRADGLTSVLIGLHSWDAAAVREEEEEANAFGPRSAVPYLVSAPRQDTETVHVSLVVLTGDAVRPDVLAAAVTAEVHGRRVLITLPGETPELILGAS
jgi:hypothetical protein